MNKPSIYTRKQIDSMIASAFEIADTLTTSVKEADYDMKQISVSMPASNHIREKIDRIESLFLNTIGE